MNTYLFHWRGGGTESLRGDDAADALNRAGYGRGALPALDYWEVQPPTDQAEDDEQSQRLGGMTW